MIPLRDENPTETFPYITVLLILINILVFLWELSLNEYQLRKVIFTFGAVPAEIIHGIDLSPYGIPNWVTLITCMFLHGGFFHLIGNMLYLWIFGNNVEDKLGHIRFLIFYILSGVFATLIHTFVYPNSTVPLIGASGAISGVLGAYAVSFPWARVDTLFFIFFWPVIIKVPAILFIGAWFFMQYLNGVAALSVGIPTTVAWFAHIGGFVAGIWLFKLFPKRDELL